MAGPRMHKRNATPLCQATSAGEDLLSSPVAVVFSGPRGETKSSSTQHELPEKIPSCYIALQASRGWLMKLKGRVFPHAWLLLLFCSLSTALVDSSRWLLLCPPQTTLWLRRVVRTSVYVYQKKLFTHL